MNIKEVEKITGISSQNIRYYEKENLISPKRNHLNTYRIYEDEDLQRLKLIKVLRALGMSLEQIKLVLSGDLSLEAALETQAHVLEEKMSDLKSAISLCTNLKKMGVTAESINLDECIEEIDNRKTGFLMEWIEDYKSVAAYEHARRFSFTPEGSITNAAEFTNELLLYASRHNLNLTITKESMYPEFEIDGEKYTAMRNYSSVSRCPVAIVMCEKVGLEKLTGRKKFLRILHIGWPSLIGLFFVIDYFGTSGGFSDLSPTQNIILVVCAIILGMAGVIRNYCMYWNMND